MADVEQIRTAPSYDEILAAVCTELDKVNTTGASLSEDTDITTDLNIDSVAVMDLLFALEERYDVSVPLNELGEVRTIGQLAKLVQQIAAKS